ncbi:hypothetical protein [Microbacterium oleivorans]|uniref:Uncharacterized protein n=1 Tax=Microbacterium oleivorans TaxID=273677 RepID=A0A177KA10_9MICO|nr:hypothetical protein [Microbacterium oleivorans]OAH50240.1 hypothetical protein AYL44_07170 [Microbacterium oleivorans]
MDDDEAAELARLRERAYGRTPDIAGDAAALARLRELEARAARRDVPAGDDAAAPEEVAPVAPAEPAAEAPPRERPRRRAPRWLVAAGAVVAAAVLVTATVAITRAVPEDTPRYPGAERVATLAVIDGGSAPEDSSAGRRYSDFRGYSVFAFTASNVDRPDVECLSVVSPAEAADDSLSVCGSAPFPVAVTAVVSEQSPDAARAAYPLGTALNFTLTGAGVEVWVGSR